MYLGSAVLHCTPTRSVGLFALLSFGRGYGLCRRVFLLFFCRANLWQISFQVFETSSCSLIDDMHEPPKATHHASRPRHGSNRLYRRVKNSGRDFVRQVVTGKAISHSHPRNPSASASAPAPLHPLRAPAEAAAKSPKVKA